MNSKDTAGGEIATSQPATTTSPSPMRTIVVNGRSHPFDGSIIDRHQVARMAYPAIDASAERSLTVAYNGGPAGAFAGLLAEGRTTEIANGQTFSVSLTDKS